MPAHTCGVTVAVLKAAAVGAVSLPDPVPVQKLAPAQPEKGQEGRLSSPLVVFAVGREASCAQGSQGDALCKGKVGTRLCPSAFLLPRS